MTSSRPGGLPTAEGEAAAAAPAEPGAPAEPEAAAELSAAAPAEPGAPAAVPAGAPGDTDAHAAPGADGAPAEPPAYPLRLQKFLARAGVASRRGSEGLIASGRVAVNGQVVTEQGKKIDPQTDTVTVDGRTIEPGTGQTYIMLNKPAGFLTTMDDPQGRPTVRQLVPADEHPGLFPVGRLDYDTTGLLLFMTDGELAHCLLHPRHHVSKRYRAVVDGQLSEAERLQLEQGVRLSDGPTLPARVDLVGATKKQLTARESLRLDEDATFSEWQSEALCTITEGRKRQVKRMFAAVGHPVLSLQREAFGPLLLGGLEPGQWRCLSEAEVEQLRLAAHDALVDEGFSLAQPQ